MWVLNANLEGGAPASALVEQYAGQSAIYNPWGQAVVQAGELTGGSLLTAVIDLDDERNVMRDIYLPEREAMLAKGYYAGLSDSGGGAAARPAAAEKPTPRGFGSTKVKKAKR